jgi:hypothetical protein
MNNIFRALVLVSIVLYAVGWFLPYFDLGFYSLEWQSFLMHDGNGAVLSYPRWVDFLLFAITVAISVMLYFYIPIARRAYLIMVIAYTGSNFLWGLRVSTPLEETIWGLVAMSDGALLTMLYLTSVAQRFEPGAAQQRAPGDRPRPAGSAGA